MKHVCEYPIIYFYDGESSRFNTSAAYMQDTSWQQAIWQCWQATYLYQNVFNYVDMQYNEVACYHNFIACWYNYVCMST